MPRYFIFMFSIRIFKHLIEVLIVSLFDQLFSLIALGKSRMVSMRKLLDIQRNFHQTFWRK